MEQCPFDPVRRQLPLTLQQNDDTTLDAFHWGQHGVLRQHLIEALQGQGERLIYIWGGYGCGKSHLLQACCHAVPSHQSAMYLPLSLLKTMGPNILEGMDEQSFLALDDIDAIAGDLAFEEALFHLYNRLRDRGQTTLLISGHASPAHITLKLPDLRTRLTWGLVFQLNELNDDDKIQTLQRHAQRRGLDLPTPVGHFLLNRCARNMHDLHALLNRLDSASLAAQRKITIPFVKTILAL